MWACKCRLRRGHEASSASPRKRSLLRQLSASRVILTNLMPHRRFLALITAPYDVEIVSYHHRPHSFSRRRAQWSFSATCIHTHASRRRPVAVFSRHFDEVLSRPRPRILTTSIIYLRHRRFQRRARPRIWLSMAWSPHYRHTQLYMLATPAALSLRCKAASRSSLKFLATAEREVTYLR